MFEEGFYLCIDAIDLDNFHESITSLILMGVFN